MQPTDILPTVLDLAGVKEKPIEPFHGKSFAPLLKGRKQTKPRDFVISGVFLRTEDGKRPRRKEQSPVLYTSKWAYVPIGVRGRRELYDLKSDPYCTKNIATQHPNVLKRLHRKFMGWLDEMGAPADARTPFE